MEPESHNFLLSLFKSLVQSFHPDEGVEEEVEVLRRRPEFKTFVDVAIVAAGLLLPLLKGGVIIKFSVNKSKIKMTRSLVKNLRLKSPGSPSPHHRQSPLHCQRHCPARFHHHHCHHFNNRYLRRISSFSPDRLGRQQRRSFVRRCARPPREPQIDQGA